MTESSELVHAIRHALQDFDQPFTEDNENHMFLVKHGDFDLMFGVADVEMDDDSIPAFSFTVMDPSTGDVVTSKPTVVLSRPTVTMTMRAVELVLAAVVEDDI